MAALGTRSLLVMVGGTEYAAQVSNCRITSQDADSDFVTFADAAAGGSKEYRLAFTAVQDPATGTLWDKVFTAPGTSVAIILRPAGGTVATPAQPHFTGNAIVKEPDGDFLGGEANASATARFTFECEFPFTAKPVRLTA